MKPCIVWQTDFGLKWGAVAAMRGVCKQISPDLECVDITHEIEQYNILAASREIMYVEPFWPKGTVFVSVVDPGVGTSRRACVAKLKDGNYIVTPDNGTLTHLFYQVGIEEVREIDETVNRYPGTENVSVFHGRDIFAGYDQSSGRRPNRKRHRFQRQRSLRQHCPQYPLRRL